MKSVKHYFIRLFFSIKCKINMDTMEPTDALTEPCLKFIHNLGSKSTKISEIIKNNDTIVHKAIEDGNYVVYYIKIY
jgi:hypothetical protein